MNEKKWPNNVFNHDKYVIENDQIMYLYVNIDM